MRVASNDCEDANMKLKIDNYDGLGPQDYTPWLERSKAPQVRRKLNKPSELHFALAAATSTLVVPAEAARITLSTDSGGVIFTGYMVGAPAFEYLGWGQQGPAYRYQCVARSDEFLLDRKRLPARAAMVARNAGNTLKQLATDLLPAQFDVTGVQNLDVVPGFTVQPEKPWSYHAGLLATLARGAYRASNGAIALAALGATTHSLDEAWANFSPQNLLLQAVPAHLNDATVVGLLEPQAYVKDYFVGDGVTLRFYMSQKPFDRTQSTTLTEEYLGSVLDATRWTTVDPAHAVSVSGGSLQVNGGTGSDGGTLVEFAELVELGGSAVLQHGTFTFSAASTGVLGGLYAGAVNVAGCLAGFRITAAGAQSQIQALINGALTGVVTTTVGGHQYALSTRLYATEAYRRRQRFHSSVRGAGNPRGGDLLNADVRVVVLLQDIDPANAATLVAPATVLYDGLIALAPENCTYALVNAATMHCAAAFTRILRKTDAEVRSALPAQGFRTRLEGALLDGAECHITLLPELAFFAAYPPAANEQIVVHYRGGGQSAARVQNAADIAALAKGSDDGIRGALLHVLEPPPRTQADCENAALALMDDGVLKAWKGTYKTWSDFLSPTNADIFPGDAVSVNAPSRNAVFTAMVREVVVDVADPLNDRSEYTIHFATDAAEVQQPLAFALNHGKAPLLPNLITQTTTGVGSNYLADLTEAQITIVASTTVTMDAGVAPPSGGGIEVRRSDVGWGAGNDLNLIGRFNAQVFSAPRLSRVQDYFLRQYDGSSPPKYSRYSAALHLDWPL